LIADRAESTHDEMELGEKKGDFQMINKIAKRTMKRIGLKTVKRRKNDIKNNFPSGHGPNNRIESWRRTSDERTEPNEYRQRIQKER